MNIEESIEILKNMILMPDGWIIGKDYKGNLEFIGCPEGQEAIETLLTAYEKEKEKNKELFNQLNYIHECFCKFNWKESSGEQVYIQLKELYKSIFGGIKQC